MICPNCGAENAQGAPYCYNCANPLPQAGASMPPGAGMPPGAPPPGPVPPAGGMPPAGGVPPGGPPQWPGGGGPGYTSEPPKPPRNTFSAGLGGLIAFLVVAGIGALLFFTVFKKEKAEPPPPQPSVSVTPPPPSASASPIESPSPSQVVESPSVAPSPKGGGNNDNFKNALRIFFCKRLIGGNPSGCANPGAGPVVLSRNLPGFLVMVTAHDFEPGHTITTAVGVPGTRVIVQEGRFKTVGGDSERKFLPILAPNGGFPPVTLIVVVLVDGQPVQFTNGNGQNIVPTVILR